MTSPSDEGGKPRLLVLASTYPRWIGDHEPRFVHELSRRLTKRFDVTVVCPGAAGASTREFLEGVEVIRFRYAPRSWQTLVNDGGITTNLRRKRWKYLLLPGFLCAMALTVLVILRHRRAQVVHAHWLLPQGWLAAILLTATRSNARLVVTSHGADLFAWRGRLSTWMKRYVLQRAHAITVVSNGMVEEVVRLGADPASVHVAPMGVDLQDRFCIDPGVPRSRGELLFVGRLVEKKGLRHLLDALPLVLQAHPEATLSVVGFGPEEVERRRQVQELGIGNAVRFVGPVPQDRLPSLYRRAAVFVAPFVEAADGDREGLGLVALEATACGAPVVVSRLPAVMDVFAPGEAVMVPPGDHRALASGISGILSGAALLTIADRSRLESRFGWTAVAARYLALLSGDDDFK